MKCFLRNGNLCQYSRMIARVSGVLGVIEGNEKERRELAGNMI